MNPSDAWIELSARLAITLLVCPSLLSLSFSMFLRPPLEDKQSRRFATGYALQVASLVASALGYWLFHMLYDACPTCFMFWFPLPPLYWVTIVCSLAIVGVVTVWQARRR